jgi:hypothetical protein
MEDKILHNIKNYRLEIVLFIMYALIISGVFSLLN